MTKRTKGGKRAESKATQSKKVQTAWHPMFAQVTQLYLPEGYKMITEYELSLEPQRIDIVVWEEATPPPDAGKADTIREMPALTTRLTKRNILEFKSPADSLGRTDYAIIHGYAYQYYNKEDGWIDEDLSLFIIAPQVTEAFRSGVQGLKASMKEVEKGIWRIDTPFCACWCLEANELWKTEGNAALSFFSKDFIDCPQKLAHVTGVSHHLYILLTQQFAKFLRRQKTMPLLHKELLQKSLAELEDEFCRSLTVEQRLKGISISERLKDLSPEERLKDLSTEERLKDISPEELLKHIPPEERLKDLSPEEILLGLSPKEKASLKKLLK
jgi:hypothetical protein